MKVGILALQGAVAPHADKLRALGAEPVAVKTPSQLAGLAGIILPGGESTTMLHLLGLNALWEPLAAFVDKNPSWGVCAGSILLANEVSHPAQRSLGALDIAVARNAFGRQSESFIAPLESVAWDRAPLEGVFIRAPRITRVGANVTTLLRWHDEPVLVQRGFTLAATFHPELTESTALHEYFLQQCEAHPRG